MWKSIINSVKLAVTATAVFAGVHSYGQQNIIANKDNTHPEVNDLPDRITSFTAQPFNGYNEIVWSSPVDQQTRRYVVEYSNDGSNYQSAGEGVLTNNGYYKVDQPFAAAGPAGPMIYRLRIEDQNGKYYYSKSILMNQASNNVVKLYPTSVTGHIVNLISGLPVERITVVATNGQQVYTQDMGGANDHIAVTLPSLISGIYWMNVEGKNWRNTEKFIVP